MTKTPELAQAYAATVYRVFLPGGSCDLRPGESSAMLRGWLADAGVREFAILTACNPGSRRLSATDNAERQARLECALLEAGYEPYAGENVAAAGDWPAEESCFVAGLPLADALALAAQFGQNAIVHGGADGTPALVWVEAAPG
jgi:hypothetical protein